MRFPPYWHRAALRDDSLPGLRGHAEAPVFYGHGWSFDSPAGARAMAVEKAQRVRDFITRRQGEWPAHTWDYYPGDGDVIREVVLERSIEGAEIEWAVTRNSYGAEVLNVDGLGILDIDVRPSRRVLPEWGPGAFFRRLLGRPARPPEPADPTSAILARLRTTLDAQPVGGRVYRTAGGFRVVFTSEPLHYDDPRLVALLEATGADPRYAAMCRQQRCCRARLTPKSWRLGLRAPRWTPRPWTEPDRWEPSDWLARYAEVCAGHAVAREVHRFGPSLTHGALEAPIAVHERCVGERPLA